MVRRALGALLCGLLLVVSLSAAYAEATEKRFTIVLQIETSYFSLDSFDDVSDFSPRSRAVNWSSREKGATNFFLAAKVRKTKFSPPEMALCEHAAQPRPGNQDILRFQEVFRI